MQGGASLPDVLTSDDNPSSPAAEIIPCLLPLPSMGGRHGFVNIGNTCFLNAALQPLLHSEPLMHLMAAPHDLVPIGCPPASPQQKAVAEEFAVIARRVWARDKEMSVRQPELQLIREVPYMSF